MARSETPGTKIAVLGFSYKKNTSDTRTSPVAMFIFTLAKRGFNVAVHDPQVT
jgi:UDP-N-acetyl-D-mannosaminuronate dehydrogenase